VTGFSSKIRARAVTLPGPQGALGGIEHAVPGAGCALVLIPGSGPTDCHGNGPLIQSDTYRLLTEGLAGRGIAAISIDKRGLFSSAAAVADANAVTLADYAADARAWVARARDLAPRVWLAGHSEGGLVALLAAAQHPPPGLAGLILLATPGRPAGDVLLDQIAAHPPHAALAGAARGIVARLVAGGRVPPGEVPPALLTLFAPPLQGYLGSLFALDPAALAARWAGPALVVQGGRDLQVTAADAARLAAALPQGRRLDLPLATHTLKTDVPGAPLATYADASLPLDPGLVPAIAAFLDPAGTGA
jgi:hypothetical protein